MSPVEPAAQHHKTEKSQSCPSQSLPHWLQKQKVRGEQGLSEAGGARLGIQGISCIQLLQTMSSSLPPAPYAMCLSSSDTALGLRLS